MWFCGFNQNNFSSVFVKVSSSCHILLLILRTSHNQTIQVRLQGLLSWGGGLYTVGEYRDIPRPPLSRDNTRDKTRFVSLGLGDIWLAPISPVITSCPHSQIHTTTHSQQTVRQLSTLTHSTEVKIRQSYMVLGLLSWKTLDLINVRHTVCQCSNYSSTMSWDKYFFPMTGVCIYCIFLFFIFLKTNLSKSPGSGVQCKSMYWSCSIYKTPL